MKTPLILFTALVAALVFPARGGEQSTTKPSKGKLKVFILAGQSNMEGHAKIETFDYLGDDPATAPLLKMMRGADGKPTVCDNVWISYFTGMDENNGEGFGKLSAGYRSRQQPNKDGGKIGLEQALKFACGVNGEMTVDGWKASKPASPPYENK